MRPYAEVHAMAQSADELTFVYFREWYRVECTEFEENVLKHPDVLPLTRSYVCVVLDTHWDRALMQRWGLEVSPAYAIVAPDGTVLARGQYPISVAEMSNALRTSRQHFESENVPASEPPPATKERPTP